MGEVPQGGNHTTAFADQQVPDERVGRVVGTDEFRGYPLCLQQVDHGQGIVVELDVGPGAVRRTERREADVGVPP